MKDIDPICWTCQYWRSLCGMKGCVSAERGCIFEVILLILLLSTFVTKSRKYFQTTFDQNDWSEDAGRRKCKLMPTFTISSVMTKNRLQWPVYFASVYFRWTRLYVCALHMLTALTIELSTRKNSFNKSITFGRQRLRIWLICWNQNLRVLKNNHTFKK